MAFCVIYQVIVLLFAIDSILFLCFYNKSLKKRNQHQIDTFDALFALSFFVFGVASIPMCLLS